MAGLYVVIIHWDAKRGPRNSIVEDALTPTGSWLRFDTNSYLLASPKNATEIYAALSAVLTKDEQELIFRADPNDYQGWSVQWINDWIKNVTAKNKQ
jgi:hypothetical protein